MNASEAVVRELLRRARARESLHTYALSIDIPTVPQGALCPDEDLIAPAAYLMAPHHAAILSTIERTVTRWMGRCIIMAPPGSAKSIYGSVVTPTWLLAKHPGNRYLLVSYQAHLAERQSRRAMQIVEQQKYKDLWLQTPALDRTAAGDWSLTYQIAGRKIDSEMLAMGFESGITGNRANGCFVGSTRIATPSGSIRIDAVIPDTVVFGYDAVTKEIHRQKVRAVRILKRENLVRVRTAAGRSFICTDDHPIFTGETYTSAGLLEAGASLTCIDGGLPVLQGHEAAGIQRVSALLLRAARRAISAAMHFLRRTGSASDVAVGKVSCERHSTRILQQVVSNNAVQPAKAQAESAARTERSAQAERQAVPKLRGGVSAAELSNAILRQEMRKRCALDPDGGERQRPMEARSRKSVPAPVLQNPAADFSAGQKLCSLLGATRARVSSHRRDAGQQPAGEPRDALQNTSSESAQQDWVAVVEQLRNRGELVYDIEVEGTHNFFAEGILAHNCIIDDPVKGREAADSEGIRQKILDGYQDDLMTRLLPGAFIVLILTRWHEADLAGSILPADYDGRSGFIKCNDGLEWEVLNLQAKCERLDDPLGRPIGEYMWPEYYPPEHWKMFEEAKGPEAARAWSSLYQQNPTPQGSGRFDEGQFDFYAPNTRPPFLAFVGASDCAVTKAGGDFTEHGVFGIDPQGELWEVDWFAEQCDTARAIEKFIDMVQRWKAPMWFNEGGVIDKAVRPAINKRMRERKVFTDLRSLPSMQDKVAKCQSFQARAAAGGFQNGRWEKGTVHFRDNANSRRVVKQLVALPAGRHDDGADVCGLIGRGIDQFPIARTPMVKRDEKIRPFSMQWLHWQEKEQKRLRYR